MDRITHSHLEDFSKKHQIAIKDDDEKFELFANYCIISQYYDDEFDPASITCGGRGDQGIDGFAMIADGELITNQEELRECLESRKKISTVKLIFIQAKTSPHFKMAEIMSFADGVLSVCQDSGTTSTNERVKEIISMINQIMTCSQMRASENPECIMYYVTTGSATDNNNDNARIKKKIKSFDDTHLFTSANLSLYGASEIQKAYRNIIGSSKCEILISNIITLPQIDNIEEAHIANLPGEEFLKLISTEKGEIRKSVFYSNVRDFQGENEVNKEIQETIKAKPAKFVLFNNGVTIICSKLARRGETFTLYDYQIVNGCQTSHILHANRENVANKNLKITVKLIVTQDDETIQNIIRATNRQTEVSNDQFIALNDFNKELESYYETYPETERLYYERRAKQYNHIADIEKTRIVSVGTQIKAFASMYQDLPHLASGYYGKLLGNNSLRVFQQGHKKIAYYLSAYLLYQLEFAYRNKQLNRNHRKYRYHLLMLFRYLHIKNSDITKNTFEREASALLALINNHQEFIKKSKEYTNIILKQIKKKPEIDTTKSNILAERIKVYSLKNKNL